jgi:histidinol-phosphate phosphatase family protein
METSRAGGVFLDRDGVINEEVNLLCRTDQLVLIPGAAEGVRLLNQEGRKVIVITNQSVVARGLVSPRGVALIHRALRHMLAQNGARLDAIFYCPYHQDADVPRYRRICDARKPGIRMLLKAEHRFRLDLRKSYMIGDQSVDIEAGRRAGCRTILVRTGFGGRDGKFPAAPDFVFDDLLSAARFILKGGAA